MIDKRYSDAVKELESRGVMPDRAPTIGPTTEGLKRLKLQIDPSRVIIVAGTNGKGSVCATLEMLLKAAGESVGLYTSPHLIQTTERIRLDGKDVSREIFVRAFDEVRRLTEDLKLSHFEMLTLMAMWIFASGVMAPAVDRVILEVGLGGTWDATNAVPHSTCVITPIGLDHQNILGKSLNEIASNKFGVIPVASKTSAPARVIHSRLLPEIQDLAMTVKKTTASHWIQSVDWSCDVEKSNGTPVFFLKTHWGKAQLNLAGERGAENSALALTVFEQLGYDPKKYLNVLAQVNWPGRMELISKSPCPIYLSGDHNVQGIKSLVQLLKHYERRHVHFLAGIGVDKEADEMLEFLATVPDSSLYLTVTPFKGRSIDNYGKWSGGLNQAWTNPENAIKEVLKRAAPKDLVVVTGSLYLVGKIREIFAAKS
jgi:dihydrofolate synthase / folylpolyglutamate synthase